MAYSRYKESITWFAKKTNINENHDVSSFHNLVRGHVAFAEFGENIGDEKNLLRPVLIISNDRQNSKSNCIIAAPMTNADNKKDVNGKIKLLATHALLEKSVFNFLKSSSIVQFENMRSISKARVGKPIGYIDKISMTALEKYIKEAVGI